MTCRKPGGGSGCRAGCGRTLIAPLAQVWPWADWLPRPLRAKSLLTNLSREPAAAYANTLSQCRPPLRRRLLAADIRTQLNGHDPERLLRESYALSSPDDPLAGMIAADMATMLPDDYLVKVDRASMAHGLEVRPPLLDHEVLELAARIPSRWKVHQGQTKWIFKQAFKDLLPAEIRQRPKQGFDIPLDAWLRGPLRDMLESTVFASNARVSNLIDQPAAWQLFREHQNGTGRHGQVLWSLLILARWTERYISPPVPRADENMNDRAPKHRLHTFGRRALLEYGRAPGVPDFDGGHVQAGGCDPLEDALLEHPRPRSGFDAA